ncbi:hypothetical protein NOVO_06730 [Rickettsiales bacterium Ac37b]|nr:hypothetical protein NOVO_06730 [Rickettsiales bacterium Ac37b]
MYIHNAINNYLDNNKFVHCGGKCIDIPFYHHPHKLRYVDMVEFTSLKDPTREQYIIKLDNGFEVKTDNYIIGFLYDGCDKEKQRIDVISAYKLREIDNSKIVIPEDVKCVDVCLLGNTNCVEE